VACANTGATGRIHLADKEITVASPRVLDERVGAQATADPRRWWVLGVMSVALLTIVLNNSVLNVAIPTLVRKLGVSTTQLQWIVDIYSIVFAGLLITAGALSDRIGRKRATLSGLVVFGLGSVLASMSTGATSLMISRGVMAAGAAFVMPGTLSILVHVFPERERQRAIAIWGAVSGLGVAIGPVLGGLLVKTLGWSWVFLLNVPIVVVALGVGLVVVPESRDPSARKVDLPGAALAAVMMSAIVYAIISASEPWNAKLAFSVGLAVIATIGFVVRQRKATHPLVDFAVLRDKRFVGASVSNMLLVFGLAAVLFILTQRLQFVLGYDALRAGLAVAPVAVAVAVGSALAGTLTKAFGSRGAVGIGMTLVSAGVLVIAFATGYPLTLGGLLLMGIGFGFAMAPAADELMASVPPERSGVGSAINDTMQEMGFALGVAVVGTVAARVYAAGLSGAPHGASASVGTALHIAAVKGGATGKALADTARAAFQHGTEQGLSIGALVVFVGAVIGAVNLRSRVSQ
jgi:EmrB/QacA subfamily drug resistance transporter